MRALDKVIGYEDIKRELYSIIDILKNPEKYAKFGIKGPRGILFYGVPGIGKTLMAQCFIEECGRKYFTVRKDKPDGEFVNYITEVFEKASEEAPAIVLLDDMDKFGEDDEYAEEYATIQACFDKYKDKDILVIVTANHISSFPHSLIRKGRIDREFRFVFEEKYKVDIIKEYMKGKPVDENVDLDMIARFTRGHSCAELESILNHAAIKSVFSGKNLISEEDIIKVCLKEIHKVNVEANDISYEIAYRNAVHEAGHVVVSEILMPGRVNFSAVSKAKDASGNGGLMSINPDEKFDRLTEGLEDDIRISLAGKAATEMIFGDIDEGANKDLYRAFDKMNKILDNYSAYDFHSWSHGKETSLDVYSHLDIAAGSQLSRYYSEVKKIIAKNRELLLRIADELVEKVYITYKDIERIKKEF